MEQGTSTCSFKSSEFIYQNFEITQKNVSSSLNGIPYLERIPLLRELSSLTTNSGRDNSLFVFLRPIILEEDKFRDLKFLSKRASNAADEGHNFPASCPLLMAK